MSPERADSVCTDPSARPSRLALATWLGRLGGHAAPLAALLLGLAACRRAPTARVTPEASANAIGEALHGVPCGAFPGEDAAVECAQYATPLEAFEDALAVGGAPLALGIGEAHAPAGATVASAAKRFTDELLPHLAGRASDLLVELMMPPTGCADAVAGARQEQEQVTSRQAASDRNEYLAMGERARALGIVPDLLRPNCADMLAMERAGDDVVDVSLATIARLSRMQAIRLLDRDAVSRADQGKMVVLYGGALHDDLDPPPLAAAWSYAPELSAHALTLGGRFSAIDLIVPEFIADNAAWHKQRWWLYWSRLSRSGRLLPRKSTLFRTAAQSFVLLWPFETAPP